MAGAGGAGNGTGVRCVHRRPDDRRLTRSPAPVPGGNERGRCRVVRWGRWSHRPAELPLFGHRRSGHAPARMPGMEVIAPHRTIARPSAGLVIGGTLVGTLLIVF